MIPFLKLIRYKNLLMVLLTMVLTKYALIHSFIEKSNVSNLEFSLLTLSVFAKLLQEVILLMIFFGR